MIHECHQGRSYPGTWSGSGSEATGNINCTVRDKLRVYFSSFTTLIIIFNMILLFSVGKNKYLHFSFHYVIVAVAIR